MSILVVIRVKLEIKVLFYIYHCEKNTHDLESVFENNDLSYFENIAIPF